MEMFDVKQKEKDQVKKKKTEAPLFQDQRNRGASVVSMLPESSMCTSELSCTVELVSPSI